MNVLVRSMVDSDWQYVSKIYLQGIKFGLSTFTTEFTSFAEWEAAHPKEFRFVCELDGVVAGWGALSPNSSRRAYKGSMAK